MGLLPRRKPRDEDGEPEDDEGPGVYRVEVDSEKHRFHQEVPYSFWASAKVILLLSVLLWWLPQSAGYMVAGYVGGRRAGAPWKAVLAALIPVAIIYAATISYDAGIAREHIDAITGLPATVAGIIGNSIPMLAPYTQFAVDYLTTFVAAVQSVFGMGSNGYLVTIAFAYIGGIVGDQTRKEIDAKGGSDTTVQIVQPVLHRPRRHPAEEPLRVHAAPRARRGHRPATFADYRKVPAEALRRRPASAHRRIVREEPEPEREEPAPVKAARPPHRPRDHDTATQRFVERALREYERGHAHRRG